jgi:hypothetical protein
VRAHALEVAGAEQQDQPTPLRLPRRTKPVELLQLVARDEAVAPDVVEQLDIARLQARWHALLLVALAVLEQHARVAVQVVEAAHARTCRSSSSSFMTVAAVSMAS